MTLAAVGRMMRNDARGTAIRCSSAFAASLSRRQRYRPRSWMVLAGRPYSSRALEGCSVFGKTVNADGNDRCSDTDRGITHRIAMFPRSRAHVPWQNRIKSDWDRPRQADLTSVGMTAHKQIENRHVRPAGRFPAYGTGGLRIHCREFRMRPFQCCQLDSSAHRRCRLNRSPARRVKCVRIR